MIKGIPVSAGIAIAKAFVISEVEPNIVNTTTDNIEVELEKLNKSIELCKNQISDIKEKAGKYLGPEKIAVFDAHLMFLQDPEFVGQIVSTIKENNFRAEHAAKNVVDTFIQMFQAMDNEYFKERAADVKDVGHRLLLNILGEKINDLSLIDEEVVLVAEDLTPSQTAVINKQFVKGFVTDIGGKTSHTAILSRTLEIAAIVGTKDASTKIKDGELVILDAVTGEIFTNPDESLINEYKNKIDEFNKYKEELKQLKNEKAITTDNHEVELAANIGNPKDVEGVLENGADAVGLFRTEFLYMGRDNFPTEDEQFTAYKAAAEGMNGKAVIIRTLDIGGDKNLTYFNLPKELNPFLGYRAIRICLQEKEMFKTQLKAILRASAFGKVRIMYPMISSVEEVIKANNILEEAKKELKANNIDFDNNIEVGIMVEIPAVAVMADLFAKYVDFFSIGTNDLCQYTLAVDRMNEKISDLYNPLHPAILTLVKNVIKASHSGQRCKFTGMCGEMASMPTSALILLGLGLDEFSMNAPSIPSIKKIIRSVTMEDAKKIAEEALTLPTGAEVEEFINKKLKELNIDVL